MFIVLLFFFLCGSAPRVSEANGREDKVSVTSLGTEPRTQNPEPLNPEPRTCAL